MQEEDSEEDSPLQTSSDYYPSHSSGESEESQPSDEKSDNESVPLHQERKYVIFHSKLMELMGWVHCPKCGGMDTRHALDSLRGTLASFKIFCSNCDQVTLWLTQPSVGAYAAGNILMSASILFAGATPMKFLRVLSHMGVMTISPVTYFRHQRSLLQPVISNVWTRQQTALLSVLSQEEEEGVVIGGDGRADSPGHSAKYGSYTVIELRHKKIIDVQLVQVGLIFTWNNDKHKNLSFCSIEHLWSPWYTNKLCWCYLLCRAMKPGEATTWSWRDYLDP